MLSIPFQMAGWARRKAAVTNNNRIRDQLKDGAVGLKNMIEDNTQLQDLQEKAMKHYQALKGNGKDIAIGGTALAGGLVGGKLLNDARQRQQLENPNPAFSKSFDPKYANFALMDILMGLENAVAGAATQARSNGLLRKLDKLKMEEAVVGANATKNKALLDNARSMRNNELVKKGAIGLGVGGSALGAGMYADHKGVFDKNNA